MELKDRIKEIRKHLGLTQKEFANDLGVSLSAVQQWEMGRRNIDDRTIKLISEKFGISEIWLKSGDGEMLDNKHLDIQKKVDELINILEKKTGRVPKWFELMIKDAVTNKDILRVIETMTILCEEMTGQIPSAVKGNIVNNSGNLGNISYKEEKK